MKVLMIATEKLPVPPIKGGAIQTYMAAVAPILAKSHTLTVLCVSDPSLPSKETVNQIHYVRIPGKENLDHYQNEILKHLNKNRYDIIHLFNRPKLLEPIRLAAPNSKLVLSMHNDMFGPDKILPEVGAAAVDNVDKIITISNYVGDTIRSLFPKSASKVRTIYSGVDPDRFKPHYSQEAIKIRKALKKQYQLEGKKVILFVGRLSPKKGADVLVRAMSELAKKHPDTALVLVGSNWYGEDTINDYVAYVRSLAARSPIPVITTGFVRQEEVQNWFLVGDIFVCTSLWQEPLARVHYEAMAAGLPIITTKRGGNPEIIRENGYVVEQPEDPSAYVEKLSILLSDKDLRRKMGRTGRALVEQKYTWERVANEILEVWEQL